MTQIEVNLMPGGKKKGEKTRREKLRGLFPGDKKRVKEKVPFDPETEIEDFIKEFKLEFILPPEFQELSKEQKLLVIRGTKQRIVDLVKSNAQTQYSESLRGQGFLTSIASSITKETAKKDIEAEIFDNMRLSDEGTQIIARELEQLTAMAKERTVSIGEDNKPEIVFINPDEYSSDAEYQMLIRDFNTAANNFRAIPYEWGQEKRGKNKKAYDKARAEYERGRELALYLETGSKGEARAMTEMLQLDNVIQMEQLINTHPEVEAEFNRIAKTASFGEFTKESLNFLQTLSGGKNITNKVLFAGGFGARMLARGATLTTGITGLTFAATPIIGGVIGGIRGRMRGTQTLEERKKQARHGQKDESKERTQMVDVVRLTNGLKKMADKVENAENSEERGKALSKLAVVIGHTQELIEYGQVNFGNTSSALINQFNLTNNLNRALILEGTMSGQHDIELKNKIDRLIGNQSIRMSERISKRQQKFIYAQMRRGALYGAGFATAGYLVRYFGENMGWWGDGDTEGVAGEIDTPPTEEIGTLPETSDPDAAERAALTARRAREAAVRADSIEAAVREERLTLDPAPVLAEPVVEAPEPEAISEAKEAIEEYVRNHPEQTREIHRSWYDNDTEDFDRNELKTLWGGENRTGIDSNGNYVLDVSSMTAEGSFHGDLSINVSELLRDGKLKFLISATSGTQDQVFEIPIDTDGQILIDPDSEVGKMFFRNVNGHAQFTGRFGEVGEDLGNNNFRMLSTIEGSQDAVIEIPEPTVITLTEPVIEQEIIEPVLPPDPGPTEEELREQIEAEMERRGVSPEVGEVPVENIEVTGQGRGGQNIIGDSRVPIYDQFAHHGGREAQNYVGDSRVPVYNQYGGYGRNNYRYGGLGFYGNENYMQVINELHSRGFDVPREFVTDDFFELLPAEQEQLLMVNDANMSHLMPQNLIDSGANIGPWWTQIKDVNAKDFLKEGNEYNTDSAYQHIRDYLRVLMEETGKKPRGGLFRSEESLEKFFARALIEAQKQGKLELIKF